MKVSKWTVVVVLSILPLIFYLTDFTSTVILQTFYHYGEKNPKMITLTARFYKFTLVIGTAILPWLIKKVGFSFIPTALCVGISIFGMYMFYRNFLIGINSYMTILELTVGWKG